MKLFFLLLCSIIFLSSCSGKYENLLKSNTAEVREFVLEGKSENVTASLVCGKREKEYIVNGYATKLVDFGVLTFEKTDGFEDELAKFVLLVGTIKFDGDLQKNPFDMSLVADIKTIINQTQKVSVQLIFENKTIDFKLELVNKNWKVDSEKVYEILAKKVSKDIDNFIVKNEFEAEVYIKIINDFDDNVSDYYWYICIIGRKGSRLSLIISPITQEILAKKYL